MPSWSNNGTSGGSNSGKSSGMRDLFGPLAAPQGMSKSSSASSKSSSGGGGGSGKKDSVFWQEQRVGTNGFSRKKQ